MGSLVTRPAKEAPYPPWKQGHKSNRAKYNFNNDKGTPEVFGFSSGDESWEIKQNGTDRVGWKNDDFSSGSGWENDFEARYPEDNKDTSNLQVLSTWLMSTNIEAATGNTLESAVTYDGIEYTTDSAEYRLAKFRAELPDYADVTDMIFYYLFTEIFLCIDQREKNAFPTLFADMRKWIMFFYDADSSLGIDNKGKLAFGPYLEDIDYTEGGDPIFNGQGSVLWVNLRKTYYNEITAMYQQLRIDNKISYDIVNNLFEKHQNKWCEAIFNEDMYRKCLEPMIKDADGQYLPMLLGKKELQRKWWLYNRFRYLDSKYVTGNSMETRIMIRAKSKANVVLTSYVDMYGHVYYNSEMVEHRMERNKAYEFIWAASGAEDAVIGINDADMITSLGDLAPLHVETIDISPAKHLTSLKIGDSSESYSNKSLTAVTLGNNVLLRSLDLRNCSSLNTTINTSGCTNIEEVYCDGTSITGISLPNGGILKTLHLPDTITNLTICNQPSLVDFVLNDSSNISTLRLENVGSSIDALQLVSAMSDGGRVRAIDIDWSVDSEHELVVLFDKLSKMRGLDENGNNTDKAVISGRCRVGEKVSDAVVGEIYSMFPDVIIDDGSSDIYIVNYKDWDGTILYTDRLSSGENAIDPIVEGYIAKPVRNPDEYYSYEFVSWNMIPANVNKHYQVIAQYSTKVAVNFCVDDVIIHSEYVIYGSDAEDPVENGVIEIPAKAGTDNLRYVFNGWDKSLQNVTLPRNINAVWVNAYPVRFYATKSSEVPHYVQWVNEGSNSYDPVDANECVAPNDIVTEDITYVFSHWDVIPTNVVGVVNVYAEYTQFWAVRFYNGYMLEDIQWVPTGQSAMDPVTSGRIVTPVRVSTAQYDYTFSGWEGEYTNVTGTRKIMATYTSTIRKYSVYFYNGDELLKTINNVQYGTSTSYTGPTPVKTGVDNPEEYIFKGWMPAPENITGDTECYALFKFTGYLFGKLDDESEYGTVDNPNWDKINPYWSVIASDVESYTNGSMGEDEFNIKYAIGGRMIIPVVLSDGTSTIADLEIIAHNHDKLASNPGSAALTFFVKDLPNVLRGMNEFSSDEGAWSNSAMRAFTNGELFESFPNELKSVIKPVLKISDGGSDDRTLVTTSDHCWLASYDEVGFTDGSNNLPGQGELYSSVFSSNKLSRKKYIVDSIETGGWWLRSSYYTTSSNTMFWRVQKSGASYGDIQSGLFYVAFGFCI